MILETKYQVLSNNNIDQISTLCLKTFSNQFFRVGLHKSFIPSSFPSWRWWGSPWHIVQLILIHWIFLNGFEYLRRKRPPPRHWERFPPNKNQRIWKHIWTRQRYMLNVPEVVCVKTIHERWSPQGRSNAFGWATIDFCTQSPGYLRLNPVYQRLPNVRLNTK